MYLDSLFEVELSQTVKYGENQTIRGNFIELYMDVYEPVGDISTLRPAIIIAFGGSFIGGEKEDVKTICEKFSSRGYVSFAIDYRLYDLYAIPDSTLIMQTFIKTRSDMLAAVKFLKADADGINDFRIDPDKIFVGGASSGAITAIHAAYLDSTDSIPDWINSILVENGGYMGNSGLPETEEYNTDVAGVMNMLGAIYKLNWINEGNPPIVSIHGTADNVVPYGKGEIKFEYGSISIPIATMYGSSLIHETAEMIGINSAFLSVENGGHGNFLKDGSIWLDSIIVTSLDNFYNWVICPNIISTKDEQLKPDFRIYPNPANTYITLINFQREHACQALLYDLSGKLIMNQKLTGNKSEIDISMLPVGMYFVRLVDQFSKSLFSSKIIVQY